MSSAAVEAYLALSADERFEARVPARLKRDAEAVARARGESLSQYFLRVVAERVADEYPATQQWRLTPSEQQNLLRLLAAPAAQTEALEQARRRSEELFGPNPT